MAEDPNQIAEEVAVDAGLVGRPVSVAQLSATIKAAFASVFVALAALGATVAAIGVPSFTTITGTASLSQLPTIPASQTSGLLLSSGTVLPQSFTAAPGLPLSTSLIGLRKSAGLGNTDTAATQADLTGLLGSYYLTPNGPGSGLTGITSAQVAVGVANGTPRTLTSRAQDDVNVADYGALGLGADSTASFQAAIVQAKATGKGISIPCGTYVFGSAIIDITGVPVRGAGVACAILQSALNQPILQTNVNGVGVSYQDYGGFTCRFTMAAGAAYSGTACLDIEGDNNHYFQNNNLHDIQSIGAYTTILVGKGDANGTFGYEGRVSVNTWARIMGNAGNNPGKYVFWFKTGSGTANVYSQISGGSTLGLSGGVTDPTAAIWRFEGTDPSGNGVVVGDITGADSQLQGPTKIVSIGSGAVYLDNIGFNNSQFDGKGNPISFDASPGVVPQGLKLASANIGGGIDIYTGLGTSIVGSVINDRYASRWAAGVTKNPTATSSNYFNLELGPSNNSGYTGTTCEFVFQGLIGGSGFAYANVKYLFFRKGPTTAVTAALLSQTYVTASGTVLTTTSGAPLTTTATPGAAPTSSGPATVGLAVAFTNSNGGNSFEGQAACSGGQFRLQRVTN